MLGPNTRITVTASLAAVIVGLALVSPLGASDGGLLYMPVAIKNQRLPASVIAPGTVAQLKSIRSWQLPGHVEAVSFSHDSAYLAWGGRGPIELYDLRTQRLVRELVGHTEWAHQVAFQPGDDLLVTGGFDAGGGRVRAWEIATGRELWSTAAAPVNWGAYFGQSPDGQWLVVGAARWMTLWALGDLGLAKVKDLGSGSGMPDVSADGTIAYWENGVMLKHIDSEEWLQIAAPSLGCDASDLAFSPDGSLVAAGAWDGFTRIWRVSDGSPVHELPGHDGWVWTVAFSHDGQVLASGGQDGSVRLWRVADGRLLRTIPAQTDAVTTLDFSPDGQWLAIGSGKSIGLWGLE